MKPFYRFFSVIVFLLIFAIATHTPADNDMWWHLRAGEEMAQQGKILLTDEFSYTQYGEAWVNAFWLSDLILYGLWRLDGFFAIAFATALMAVAVMGVVFLHMKSEEQDAPILRGLLLLLAMMGAVANWTPRPQLSSFLFLAILDFFLHRHFHIKRQPLWILPLLFAAWGNFHGGYIWGALLMIAVWVGELFNLWFNNQPSLSWRELFQLGGWGALALLAVAINPNGFAMWRLPFTQVDVSLAIQEWLSPDFHQFYAHPLLWLFFLWIFALGFGGKRLSFVDLFKALGFAYLFFFAQRNLVALAVILPPVVARHLEPALAHLFPNAKRRPPKSFKTLNLVFTAFLATLVFTNVCYLSRVEQMTRRVPERSAAWLERSGLQGRMLNSYNWGGYIIWRLREYPVFIDGRADLYGDALLTDWRDMTNGSPRGMELLDKYQIDLIYLEPHQPLLQKLPAAEWRRVYADSQMSIYQRAQP